MSELNPLTLAKLPPNELRRLLEELQVGNREYIRGQKMIAPRIAMVKEALRVAETKEDDLLISDHALVRWMERVEGFDFTAIKAKMRAIAAGRYDPKCDHDVIVSEEDRAVLIIRGRNKSKPDEPAMVVTILDTDGPIPEPGQLSVMKQRTDG